MQPRVYADTSVIGGCLDVEYEAGSQRLLAQFVAGSLMLVLSDLTLLELSAAPPEVQAVLREGYPLLEIRTPLEVVGDADSEESL